MNASPLLSNAGVQRLLAEAAEWRLIGMLFECPGEGWLEQIESLAAEVADPVLKDAAQAARQEASAGLFQTTFGPGGPASPREVSHRGDLLPGGFLSELQGYYDAFAYRPTLPEPPDHVAIEAGFVGYLRLKEAYALAGDDELGAAVVAEAAAGFLSGHLSRIAGPLALSLASSGVRYLTLAGDALRGRAAAA